jgi:hypothetical protein
MRGARYGTIIKVGRKAYTVRLDKLARPVKVSFDRVEFLGEVDWSIMEPRTAPKYKPARRY